MNPDVGTRGIDYSNKTHLYDIKIYVLGRIVNCIRVSVELQDARQKLL
jgi:hypothetical protein